MLTAGSQSVENSGTALRMAGAEVRAILIELAAKRLALQRAESVLTAIVHADSAPYRREFTPTRRRAGASSRRLAPGGQYQPTDSLWAQAPQGLP